MLKATVSPNLTLGHHADAYKPDVKILFVRQPAHNWASLKKKSYRNVHGTMREKFGRLEQLFTRRHELFDTWIACVS